MLRQTEEKGCKTSLNNCMARKINWERFRYHSRLARDRSTEFTVKPRSGISPDAPLCSRCGAYMLERVGTFGRFWGCSQFPRCRATQNGAGPRLVRAKPSDAPGAIDPSHR